MTNEHGEGFVMAEVLTMLGQRPDVRLWRASVGAAMRRGKWYSFGTPGQGDLIGVVRVCGVGIHLEIETKSENGRLSEEQKMRQSIIERFGGIYIVARSGHEAESKLADAIKKARLDLRKEWLGA